MGAGDAAAVRGLLARDVTVWCDGGGLPGVPRDPLRGADAAARYLATALVGTVADAIAANGRDGALLRSEARVVGIVSVRSSRGRIAGVWLLLASAKLAGWDRGTAVTDQDGDLS